MVKTLAELLTADLTRLSDEVNEPDGEGGFKVVQMVEQLGDVSNDGQNTSRQGIEQMLEAATAKYGIPPNILKAVAYQESRWKPDAKSFDGGHGKGIMQIDDRYYEFARTPEVFDQQKNIEYGAKYLADLYKKTGSWEQALKRYNGGSDYPPKIMAHARNKPWENNA